jgi:hypothetical protein
MSGSGGPFGLYLPTDTTWEQSMELVILTARENPSYFSGYVWCRPYARAETHTSRSPQAVPCTQYQTCLRPPFSGPRVGLESNDQSKF